MSRLKPMDFGPRNFDPRNVRLTIECGFGRTDHERSIHIKPKNHSTIQVFRSVLPKYPINSEFSNNNYIKPSGEILIQTLTKEQYEFITKSWTYSSTLIPNFNTSAVMFTDGNIPTHVHSPSRGMITNTFGFPLNQSIKSQSVLVIEDIEYRMSGDFHLDFDSSVPHSFSNPQKEPWGFFVFEYHV